MKLKDKITQPFNKKKLKYSKCYDKAILNSLDTQSKMYMGKPLWFYSQGLHKSVGIAKKVDNNFEVQKRRAIIIAQSNLMKKTSTYTLSKIRLIQILKHANEAVLIDSKSIQKSMSKIKKTKLNDIWLDPSSCELYVLIEEIE